jgi:hypothetical protein
MKRTEEQEAIIKAVEEGHNVFVDACIGAGKTTTLNDICVTLKNKKILYLTYNKLLKEDAKKQIRSRNVEVHNYHGFVYRYLMAYRIPYTHQNGIKDFIKGVQGGMINMPQYDVMLVDEYQDINDDACKLIHCIDEYQRKEIQIVFVGDMKQKIYDTTTINVLDDCIFKLRDDFKQMDLTNCFRLNDVHAEMLGKIWNKKIKGVNPNQKVEIIGYETKFLYEKINEYENKDILILSPFRNNVVLNQFINFIEKENPDKYNKKNLYITISDTDNANKPLDDSMIVTTFDGSKGLERKLAIVFGFETSALAYRSEKSNREIIRNLFLVAASRGKDEIFFIEEDQILTEKNFESFLLSRKLEEEYSPSKMFDFCFDTDIERTFKMLETREIETLNKSEIKVTLNDYNISLAPVIGIYQEAIFFDDWDYHKILESFKEESPIVKYIKKTKPKTKIKEVLCIAAIETNLIRYYNQAIEEFIEIDEEIELVNRLKEHLDPGLESQIEVYERVNFSTRIRGYIDTVKESTPYELKFVDQLEYKHFLQIATYMYLGGYDKGILWNTKYNQMFEVKIKDRQEFIRRVIKTIQKIK